MRTEEGAAVADARPVLAVTMGDPAGTGPEIITKALADAEVRATCRPLVVGDAAVMREALNATKVPAEVRAVAHPSEATFDERVIEVLDLQNVDVSRLARGRVSALAGKAAYEYVKSATELALAGKVGGIVTSAINKEALHAAGYRYDGHTGLLAELCGTRDVTMMLVAGKLRVAHVSTHLSLREALERVRPERILKVLRLLQEGLERLGIARPRLAVAGLNPHAGEGGLFGDEETRYIVPAIEEARRQGIDASGPFPGDTVFFRTLHGEFDGAVAMYHDQGHVAAKMLGIWLGVNVTLGLPIIRTSVEHGTNFDMAGTGASDPRSLIGALALASTMARRRATAGRASA
jgi:4-phospho-D-threonate 3-dehydrogenase / 4-phospho-D-erythronate 3-dehydrogenase